MKRIIGALKAKLSRPKVPVAVEQPSNPVSVKPDDFENNDYKVEMLFDAEIHGRIDSQRPGKNILMPDIYADERVGTVPDLKVIDQPSPDADTSTGFNPYDTAKMHKKKRSGTTRS